MSEEWRPVVGYEGLYEVSNLGRVRSLERYVIRHGGLASGRPLKIHGRIRKLIEQPPWGYPVVSLSKDGVPTKDYVHRLVLGAFVGPCPEGEEVRHLDGNQRNPKLTNLAYGTSSENRLDTIRHGTDHNSRKTHCPQGHPYDLVNTYIMPSRPTARYCRACGVVRDRKRTKKWSQGPASNAAQVG